VSAAPAHLDLAFGYHENSSDVVLWTMAQESGPREWTVEEVAEALPVPDLLLAETLESLVAAVAIGFKPRPGVCDGQLAVSPRYRSVPPLAVSSQPRRRGDRSS
jgi:hypothetical protein